MNGKKGLLQNSPMQLYRWLQENDWDDTDLLIMGGGKQYKITKDSGGESLKGEKYYKVHLPKGIPPCNFWSVIIYDSHTRLMIQTDQPWPSVYSSNKGLMVNRDGSVDIRFGPADQSGEGFNFINTTPGKNWFMIMRLYDLSEPCNDKMWKPDEIREVVSDSE